MRSLGNLAVLLLLFTVRLLPVRLAGAIGAGLGRLLYHVDRRHREVALRNLARVYPERPRRERVRLARESFAELGRTLLELPHVFLRSKTFLLSRIEVVGEEAFRNAMQAGKGVILTACHHSNWELGALSFSMLGYESDIIYRPLRQPAFERFLKQARERFGAHLQSRHEGLRWLPRAIKNGHSIAVMVDQHLSVATPVPFLGHLANTTTLPATFAGKYGTPVFGVALHRLGRGFRFRLEFWPIPLVADSDDHTPDEAHMMETICESFAPAIHARPELWLWSHRRWRILDDVPGMAEVVHGAP